MCFQNFYHPRFSRGENTYTKHLIASHYLSWGQNTFPEGLPSSRSLCYCKTSFQNVYHLHTAFNAFSEHLLFSHSLLRSRNIYTKHLIVWHTYFWCQNVFPEGLSSSNSLSWSQTALIPSSHSHCRGWKCVYRHLYRLHISPLHVKIGVPYVYHVQRAIPDDKPRVRNIHHPHTVVLKAKNCFLNIYRPHSLCIGQNTCTKHLPFSHSSKRVLTSGKAVWGW